MRGQGQARHHGNEWQDHECDAQDGNANMYIDSSYGPYTLEAPCSRETRNCPDSGGGEKFQELLRMALLLWFNVVPIKADTSTSIALKLLSRLNTKGRVIYKL